VLQLTEVLPAQAEQRGAIELGVAAHIIIGVGMQFLAVFVAPNFLGVVFALDVDGERTPVVLLARDIIAAIQDQDAEPGGGQVVG